MSNSNTQMMSISEALGHIFKADSTWKVEGKFLGQSSLLHRLSGRIKVVKNDENWMIREKYDILTPKKNIPIHFLMQFNMLTVNDSPEWTSSFPGVGQVMGKYSGSSESLLNEFEGGGYSGLEIIKPINEDQFSRCGTLMENDVSIAYWACLMSRETASVDRIETLFEGSDELFG